jgi:NAD(P)H-quinone oxidoreductase subunit 4
VGFANSDAFSLPFRVIVVILAAIGVILTPVYLLSMLREIFYGPKNEELDTSQRLIDAEPREVFVIACLLIPIIGIGFYPKLLTQVYDAKTMQLTQRLRGAVPALAQADRRDAIAIEAAKSAPVLR